MKVILSRKGMDSLAGGMPSPILPDGTLLSLPIPDNKSNSKYEELYYQGKNLQEIIRQLNPKFDFDENKTCHLDPDIYDDITLEKSSSWKPAFGQCGISATHLDKLKVSNNDIFLFYGMFQPTEQLADGTLAFVKSAPIRHIIYGYMRIGEILKDTQAIKQQYSWHPHSQNDTLANNRLYLPIEYGTFHYDDKLVLTQRNQDSRRVWQLPSFFAQNGISISWQGKNHPIMKEGFSVLNSSVRGQEFVITTSTAEQQQNLCNWVENLIHIEKRNLEGAKMDQIITEICNADLKKGIFENSQFIFFAENGAMGEAGKVLIITSGGSIFHCNYCYGDISLNKLYRSIPVLKACKFSAFGDEADIPNSWSYEYLGAGNHLLIRNDVYPDFKEVLKSNGAEYPEDVYQIWFDTAWNIIEKQNKGKLPLSTKTADELILLMNKATQSSKPMTEEETIEYDSENGYDPYES